MNVENQSASNQTGVLVPPPTAHTAAAVVESGSHAGNHRVAAVRTPDISMREQVIIFMTLMLSIVASRFVDFYRAAMPWNPFRDWQYLVFAAIISLLAFPVVYRKVRNNRTDPVLVQIGIIFTAGLGWEKMLSTAADLVKR